MKKQLLSDVEYKRLILIACNAQPLPEEQVLKFIYQCEHMKIQSMMLEAILSGMVDISRITDADFNVSRRSAPIPDLL